MGGITTQLCAVGTYGTGFPTLSVDAASKKRETWSDGFGRVIEVDEPDSSNNLTLSTCYKYDLNNNLSEIDQGSETRTYTHDGLSRVTSETSPEEGASGTASGTTTYSYTNSTGGLILGNTYQVSVWMRADAGTTAQAMLWVHDTVGGNQVQSALFTPGTTWQQVSVTFTADSTNAMRIHLYYAAGAGTIYYDDVQVLMMGTNHVVNPGFESGGSGWYLGFWGSNSSITSAQSHSGSYSLAQTGSVTGGSFQDIVGSGLCAGAASAVCSRTDARGVTITFTYDAENRLKGKTYSDSTPPVSYYYDQTSYNGLTITNGLGRRTGMADGSGQTAWSYNVKGQVLTEQRKIGGVTKAIIYGYLGDGTLNAMIYPSGESLSYGFDSSGQLLDIYDNHSYEFFINPNYAATGALTQMQAGGSTMAWTYNKRFWPATFVDNPGGSGHNVNLAFSYLGNGDVSSVQNNNDTSRTATYTYDNLNRLSTAASQATSGANCWGQSYSYDRYANLTTINSTQCSSPTMSVTVNSKNQVTNSGFTYDSGGNLTADGTYTYTWNGDNRLATVNGVTYTYDGDGKRVQKSNGTIYWYDISGNVIEETDANGNLVNDYVFGAGLRLARRDASGNIYTYYNDPLGSARYIQGPGNTHAESDFYPFGGERVISSNLATPNNRKFTGMERDSESGLDHTLYRQFTSTYGRWLSPDPHGGNISSPQSFNRYAYVLNNPTTLTDPLGLYCLQGQPCPPDDGGDPFLDEFFWTAWGFGGGYFNVNEADVHDATHDAREGLRLLQQLKLVNKSRNAILQALQNDGDCLSFLSGKTGNALATLAKLPIDVEDLGPGGPAAITGVSKSIDTGLPSTSSTTINSQGAFFDSMYQQVVNGQTFNGNTGQQRALILLHELGHATGVLNQQDGSGQGAQQAQAQNNSAILNHCSKTIAACSGD